jgi:hypothetical protein
MGRERPSIEGTTATALYNRVQVRANASTPASRHAMPRTSIALPWAHTPCPAQEHSPTPKRQVHEHACFAPAPSGLIRQHELYSQANTCSGPDTPCGCPCVRVRATSLDDTCALPSLWHNEGAGRSIACLPLCTPFRYVSGRRWMPVGRS